MKDRLRELFAAEPTLVNRVHLRSGLTPLFTLPPDESAAIEMARFLLELGADRSFRGKGGDMPAQAARKRGFDALAAVLSAPPRDS
jgi:hypothetical protein